VDVRDLQDSQAIPLRGQGGQLESDAAEPRETLG
jgi:hypothetical protein